LKAFSSKKKLISLAESRKYAFCKRNSRGGTDDEFGAVHHHACFLMHCWLPKWQNMNQKYHVVARDDNTCSKLDAGWCCLLLVKQQQQQQQQRQRQWKATC
jgi:hypothetical protein